MYVNRNAVYPYTSREDWRHRGWLLVRKVCRAGTQPPSSNDRRVAMLLLKHQAYAASDSYLRPELERIAYGSDSDEAAPGHVPGS